MVALRVGSVVMVFKGFVSISFRYGVFDTLRTRLSFKLSAPELSRTRIVTKGLCLKGRIERENGQIGTFCLWGLKDP